MPVDLSGIRKLQICRSGVSSTDGTRPTGNNGTISGTDTAVEVPVAARGGVTHVLVYIDGTANNSAAEVTVMGLPDISGGISDDPSNIFAGKWFSLWALNSGSTINRDTRNKVYALNNDVLYAESLMHVSLYKKLTVNLTNVTSATVYVAFVFEEP